MGKSLYIAEKPSVAQEFAKALHINTKRKDGYLESEEAIVTWCVGHLVTMSYPEEYDPALKRWSLETLPFIPQEFKYEVIPAVSKQFRIVSGLLNRADVDTIFLKRLRPVEIEFRAAQRQFQTARAVQLDGLQLLLQSPIENIRAQLHGSFLQSFS